MKSGVLRQLTKVSRWGTRFFKKTGIKESDWLGKFWIRWGDAVKEAGFARYEKQGAYEDEELLEKLVALIRELGHFPLAAELRMKAHSTISFPIPRHFDVLASRHS